MDLFNIYRPHCQMQNCKINDWEMPYILYLQNVYTLIKNLIKQYKIQL